MNKQSLLQLKQAINEYLTEQDEIDITDRVELIKNINQFLEPKQYDENIKILELHRRKK